MGAPPSRPPVIPLSAAVLTAMLAFPATAALAAGPVGAAVTALDGQAEVIAPGGATALPACVGMRLVPGSTVRTRADGRVELQFDDRSILRLDRNTEIQILGGASERGVMVALGRIWAHVQSVLGVSKFAVKTPTAVAGVRGTILRAEVSADESTIAVDEGEVEISSLADATPVRLRQNMQLRILRGVRGARPAAFRREAREQWEFWTDPLVQQRLREIEESADAVRTSAVEARRQAQATHESLSMDAEAVRRIAGRMAEGERLLRSVAAAAAPGPRPAPPGRPKPDRAELLARLDAADRIHREMAPLLERGRGQVSTHLDGIEALRRKLAEHRQAHEELQQRLGKLRAEREVDPHWRLFRPAYDRCEGRREELLRSVREASPLLTTELPPQLGEDPRRLPSIQACFQWCTRKLDLLDQQLRQREAWSAELRSLLAP